MSLRLIRADGALSFELAEGAARVVGRGLESDIAVSDPTISRRHAEISIADGGKGIQVRDLGSSNGTFVNGTRVDAGHAAVGDVIAFGQVLFRVAVPPGPRTEVTPDGAHTQMVVRLGGEKCRVAVLFSDIRGFSALSELLTPEEVARQLSEYFTAMVACVYRNGGTLDKFIGDAVMAQWGAPTGAPDDADRAMRAAAAMLDELERLNVAWQGAGRPALAIGIGLGYGDVFAGHIGSEQRLEFTVIGAAVNTASRLCAIAEAGEILLSGALQAALSAPPPLQPCPPLELKGTTRPIPVYRVAR